MNKAEKKLRVQIEKNIKKIYFAKNRRHKFIPGKTRIQYGGSYLDEQEINAGVSTLINGWFGLGSKGIEFEEGLAKYLNVKGSILTNSGSSASLLAVSALMSPLFPQHLKAGDEVITPACGFPTTVNPLILYGLTPVFLDVSRQTYNLEISDLEEALSKKTRAIFLPHTLGNPNEMNKIMEFCHIRNLFLIEDNCDALGSEYEGKKTGSFGIMSTQSFYPAHHMTIGEGGSVNYNDLRLNRIIKSLRDWGRSCWCSGQEKEMTGACRARFNFKIGGMPYDHRYIYNHIGFNLKPIEVQAAIGLKQLKRLPFFVEKRNQNFKRMMEHAKKWEKFFILPKSLPKAKPCWFAFPLSLRENIKFSRQEIIMFLEKRLIETRPVFAGNILRQPAYLKINRRVIGKLKNADYILHNTFFVGIYPRLGNKEIDYIAESINDFLKKH